MKQLIAITCLLGLAACAADMGAINNYFGDSQPIEYKQGYRDGIDSGYAAAGHPYYKFSKDVIRFRDDPLYRQGWIDGYNVAKGNYDDIKDLSRGVHY